MTSREVAEQIILATRGDLTRLQEAVNLIDRLVRQEVSQWSAQYAAEEQQS